MNKRYIIAGALIIVGLLLIFAAVPVSGDLDIDPEEKKNRR